jgi:hypothetical protein
MPGQFDSMAYSWNMGPIHFIAISTEFYYYLEYGMKPVAQQYEWLIADLEVRRNFYRSVWKAFLKLKNIPLNINRKRQSQRTVRCDHGS